MVRERMKSDFDPGFILFDKWVPGSKVGLHLPTKIVEK